MRRRNSGPTVTVRRQGPGLVQTAARTAVIAGTATAVSTGVQGAMTKGARQQAAAQQQAQAEQAAAQQQAMLEQAAQAGAEQALAAQAPATGATTPLSAPSTSSADRIAQLKELAGLKEAGILTEEEFQAEKARILAG
jgi:type II secretory pathway pseudopilin PulG